MRVLHEMTREKVPDSLFTTVSEMYSDLRPQWTRLSDTPALQRLRRSVKQPTLEQRFSSTVNGGDHEPQPPPTPPAMWQPHVLIRAVATIDNATASVEWLRIKCAALLALDAVGRPSDMATIPRHLIKFARSTMSLPFIAPKGKRHLLWWVTVDKLPESMADSCAWRCTKTYIKRSSTAVTLTKDRTAALVDKKGAPYTIRYTGLFVGLKNGHGGTAVSVKKDVISHAIRAGMDLAGVDAAFGAYSARKAAASRLLNAGVDEAVVMQQGRWSAPNTMRSVYWYKQRYTRVPSKTVRGSLARLLRSPLVVRV